MTTQQKLIWLDGSFIQSSTATVPIATHALHYGSSVFEGIRSYHGSIFKVHDHYERFQKSAEHLGFNLPYSIEALEKATCELVTQEKYEHGYIRALAWCGTNKMTVGNRGIDIHVAIMGWERPLYRDLSPIRLIESRWRRPDPRTAPVHSKASGLYMTSTISKNEAESQGYDEAILLDYRGFLAEASSSNIFIVKDSKLITPIPHSFLNGITRLTILDLAKILNITIEERDVSFKDLQGSTEAFLTGTAIEILSIREMQTSHGRFEFKSNEITTALKQAFYQLTHPIS